MYGDLALQIKTCKKRDRCTLKEFITYIKTKIFKDVKGVCFKRYPYNDYDEEDDD